MVGGIGSAVHRLSIRTPSSVVSLVLRQYESQSGSRHIAHEARVLAALEGAAVPVPAPRLVAAAPDGVDGHPSLLMSRLPGRVFLQPSVPEAWIAQIARAAAAIHDLSIDGIPPFHPWFASGHRRAPDTASDRRLWTHALDLVGQLPPPVETTFIHGDFQHFNLLWSRERLTGVIDWTFPAIGPRAIDVGHCRLNLVVLFGAGMAEQLRLSYEAEVGMRLDPWWDLAAVTAYDDEWMQFIPVQVGGRAPVDAAGMTSRVEELVRLTLRRL